jgi:DNA-binding response OmpR family regulator
LKNLLLRSGTKMNMMPVNSNQNSKSATILVVEDDFQLATALEEKLSKENYQVLVARDGQEGLQQALAAHPDLILLDIVMPVMDGVTMLTQLRQDPWGQQAKVIILSNLSDGEAQISSSNKLAAEYLIKTDWTLEDLIAKVAQKLAHSPLG